MDFSSLSQVWQALLGSVLEISMRQVVILLCNTWLLQQLGIYV